LLAGRIDKKHNENNILEKKDMLSVEITLLLPLFSKTKYPEDYNN
jgi:hypothetical protein